MASRQSDPIAQLIGLYLGLSLFLILVVFASPVFLVGVAAIVGYKLFQGYQRSPTVLARRAREQSLALTARAEELTRRHSFPDVDTFVGDVMREFIAQRGDVMPTVSILAEFQRIARVLYTDENLTLDSIAPPEVPDALLDARYQDALSNHLAKISDPDAANVLRDALVDAFSAFTNALPPMALRPTGEILSGESDAAPGQFSVQLLEAMPAVGQAVENLIWSFFSNRITVLRLFDDLRTQLIHNKHAVSGIPVSETQSLKHILPSEHSGEPSEIVSGYLRYTPLEHLFSADVPFAIPAVARMEHWHLVAGSGHGKTQTLQHIIMGDLHSEDQPALVIIDSQGDMLRKIQCLALFENSDRLVIIDPEDDVAPALNMFDVPSTRMQGYSRAVREQVEAGLIELFNYVFGALASELTAKQGTAFAYITRLMLSIPGATIHTFRELMETAKPEAFAPYVQKLDPTARAFFENQFFNRNAFGETRQQIARRLYTVLQVPAFERMFTSEKNRLDMFAAMQSGKVVLVNTSKALLKTDASALFGRYMIALTLNAAFERVAVPENLRTPAYLIIDEAAEYFDETLERLLAQARKFKLGVLFAHQHMEQLTPALRSAVAANTSVKMAGGLSDHDARSLSADMRTTPAFLGAMRKHGRSTEFACHIRNYTENAVRVRVPFGTMEDVPTMSREVYGKLLKINRARYGIPAELEPVTLHKPDLPWKRETPTGSKPSPRRRDPDDVDMKPTDS